MMLMSHIFSNFSLFFTDELLESITLETYKHASEYRQTNKYHKEHSDLKKWPENGISGNKMTSFIALTFYFRIVKKEFLHHYCLLSPSCQDRNFLI